MRRLLTVLLGCAALALGACGDDDEGTTTSAPAASTEASAAAFPVTIDHAFGRATIERAPQRVVTAGFNEQDFALALGVKPVAIREFLGPYDYQDRPWAPEAKSDPATLIGGEQISIEKVAAAKPDVILGIYSFIDQAVYDRLAALAPTVAQSKDAPTGGTPWDDQLRQTGEALGKEAEAAKVIEDVDGQFAAAAKAHPDFRGKELVVAFESGGTLFTLGNDDLRQQFFTDLGFVTPKDGGEEEISREQLRLLDKDALVLITDDAKGILRDPLYRRLKVVREGRVITATGDSNFAGALGYNSPLSRPYLLKQVVPQLAAAIDGDPATKVPATS
ncbi:iron-siderophore ABC transporter substrate-binding protein [Patulibacter brassicae]|uniref:Iron-siderophore ABC transporter substrate-binding protein n=1 Tax=Patulibacter brassicae TaxID=1705717 RepID=A0ABU4VLB1_9ACTN|nr:iron-siderophore ABC transporter substrate-binding protein [Patulibacter brassicae]MDX8152573.1 iron-siderophore ABC transporter substrate-binding protein [Patulibacter brassicae]